jgi:hypothetical protein
MAQATTAPLRLLAEDDEDLKVISSAVQDAVAKVGDIRFDPADRTLTVAVNRFRWEAGSGERVRAALQLGSVLSVQTRRVRREPKDAVIELLSVTFEPGEAPGGVVMISLAGGGDLRAEVECLDVALADVSAPWPTRRTPQHDLGKR